MGSKQIAQASNDEILDQLLKIYIMVGLRPQHYPGKLESTVLIRFVRSHYFLKTLDELVLAFDLAIQGKLNVDEVKVYDLFSCEYLARIMNAYREYLKNLFRELSTLKEQPVLAAPAMTDRDYEEWLSQVKEGVRLRMVNALLMPPSLFTWLEQKGRIRLSIPEKNEYLEKAVRYMSGYYQEQDDIDRLRQLNRQKEDGVLTGEMAAIIKTVARQMALYDWIINENEHEN